MRSHHSFKPTFYLEYSYVQAGTAIRTVPVKISEVLYQVCFTFSDKLLSIHTTSNITQFPHIKHGCILEKSRNEKAMNALLPKLFQWGTINSSEMFQYPYNLNMVYHMTIQHSNCASVRPVVQCILYI